MIEAKCFSIDVALQRARINAIQPSRSTLDGSARHLEERDRFISRSYALFYTASSPSVARDARLSFDPVADLISQLLCASAAEAMIVADREITPQDLYIM